MSYEFFLPELGEGIKSGTVIALSFSPGDSINKEDPILEIETDKAAMGLPAPISGKLIKYVVSEGQDIKVGDLIAVFDVADAKPAVKVEAKPEEAVKPVAQTVSPEVAKPAAKAPVSAPKKVARSLVKYALPELGEGIKGGAVLSVFVSVGDALSEGDPVIELETDKAAMSVPSPVAGIVKSIHVKNGQEIKIGELIVEIEADEEVEASAPKDSSDTGPKDAASAQNAPKPIEQKFVLETSYESNIVLPAIDNNKALVRAGPATRKFARELGVDLLNVTGTKRNGRIDVQDVKNHIKEFVKNGGNASSSASGSPQALNLPDFSKWGKIRKEPLSKIRKIIADRMVYNWNTIPHVYQFQDIDITAISELQKKFGNDFKEQGSNASPTNFFIKAMVHCLKAFPQFNSSINVATGELIYKEYYNIGVAVDTPAGLLVPVLRGVDNMSIFDIGKSLREIAGKARDRKITPDEMMGASMTLSNLGGIGGTHFTPIVPWPEVAILGVAKSQMKPTWNGSSFEPRNIVTICLSYDHRVIDGADAARYVVKFKDLIENYEKTLMGAL